MNGQKCLTLRRLCGVPARGRNYYVGDNQGAVTLPNRQIYQAAKKISKGQRRDPATMAATVKAATEIFRQKKAAGPLIKKRHRHARASNERVMMARIKAEERREKSLKEAAVSRKSAKVVQANAAPRGLFGKAKAAMGRLFGQGRGR